VSDTPSARNRIREDLQEVLPIVVVAEGHVHGRYRGHGLEERPQLLVVLHPALEARRVPADEHPFGPRGHDLCRHRAEVLPGVHPAVAGPAVAGDVRVREEREVELAAGRVGRGSPRNPETTIAAPLSAAVFRKARRSRGR
jgi:hypothetical protein